MVQLVYVRIQSLPKFFLNLFSQLAPGWHSATPSGQKISVLAGFPHASKTRAGEPPPSLFYPLVQRSHVSGCSVGSSAGFQQIILCGLALGRAAYTRVRVIRFAFRRRLSLSGGSTRRGVGCGAVNT